MGIYFNCTRKYQVPIQIILRKQSHRCTALFGQIDVKQSRLQIKISLNNSHKNMVSLHTNFIETK